MRAAWTAVLTLALCAPAAPSFAYLHVVDENGDPTHWEQTCVGWWMHQSGSADLTPSETYAALKAGFEAWNGVETSYVRFQDLGATCFAAVGKASWPGPQNVMLWRDGEGVWDYPTRVVALTKMTFDRKTGSIVDADTEFNGEKHRFAVDGDPYAYDLRAVMTHEAGHVLGLDHSLDATAVMAAKSEPGDLTNRVLKPDDVAAIAFSHPLDATPDDGGCDAEAEPVPLDTPYCPPQPVDDGCHGAGAGPAVPLALAFLWATGWLRRRRARRC